MGRRGRAGPALSRRRRRDPSALGYRAAPGGRCSPESAGSTIRLSSTSSRPSIVRKSSSVPVDHACGLHAVGYCTGYFVTPPHSLRTPPADDRRRSQQRRGSAAIWAASAHGRSAAGPGDERAVEGPHGADVVADRVVAPLALGERPTPQPEKSLRPMRCFTTAFAFDLSTMPLQSSWPLFDERESTCFLPCRAQARATPSLTQKSRLKRRRGRPPAARGPRREPGPSDESSQAGAAQLRVVRVALKLAGRPRKAGEASVVVGDRVPGVLPALVLQPSPRCGAGTTRSRYPSGRRTRRSTAARPGLALEVSDEPPVAGPRVRTRRAGSRRGRSRPRSRSRENAAAPRRPSAPRTASRGGSVRDPRHESRRPGCLPGPEGAKRCRRQLGRERERLEAP